MVDLREQTISDLQRSAYQERIVDNIARLRRLDTEGVRAAIRDVERYRRQIRAEIRRQNVPVWRLSLLSDLELRLSEIAEELRERLTATVMASATAGFIQGAEAMSSPIQAAGLVGEQFSLSSDQKALAGVIVAALVSQLVDDVRDSVARAVSFGMVTNRSPTKTIDMLMAEPSKIDDVSGIGQGKAFRNMKQAAEAIIRTETLRNYNLAGQLRLGEMSAIVPGMKKTWISALVELTRPGHAALHNVTIDAESLFTLVARGPRIVFTPGPHAPGLPVSELVNCVLDGNTLVETKAGAKKIRDIQFADLVLTHNNKYRRVLGTMRRIMTRIHAIEIKSEAKAVLLTREHQVATECGWVEACLVCPGDKLQCGGVVQEVNERYVPEAIAWDLQVEYDESFVISDVGAIHNCLCTLVPSVAHETLAGEDESYQANLANARRNGLIPL